MALSRIGNEGVQITDFDTDTGKSARQCRLHYQPTLDEIVRVHTWNCSKSRIKLSVQSVIISGTSYSDGTIEFLSFSNGFPKFQTDLSGTGNQFVTISNDGAGTWTIRDTDIGTFDTWTIASTSYQPPLTGWSIGSEQASPAPTLVVSEPDFGWGYEFALPTDCIRPLFLSPTDELKRRTKTNSEWTVEGRTILSNYSTAFLLYIAVPDIDNMDSLFLRAFYTLLAAKLAIPVSGYNNRERELLEELDAIIMPEARRVNSFEGYETPIVDSEWFDATYSTSTNYRADFASTDFGSFPWA